MPDPSVLRTLVAAFFHDPLYAWLFPDPRIRPQALSENFTLALDAAADHGIVDVDHDGQAVAVWTPPGSALFTEVEPFVAMLARWSPQRRDQALAAMAATGAYTRPEDMTLQIIAVHPIRQGQRTGQRLLQRRLNNLGHRKEVPVYLESSNPRNVSFYERMGFASLGEVNAGVDGPVVRPMRRPSERVSRGR